MFLVRYGILLVLLNIDQIDSLKALPRVEENNIQKTADIIKSTANKLFSAFKLRGKKNNPKLIYYSFLHNSLIKLSLHDYTTLREIAKLTRVDMSGANNRTADFIAGLKDMGTEFGNETGYGNASLPIKEYIDKIWSIRNVGFEDQKMNLNTTVGPELGNVTLEDWEPHPLISSNRRIFKGRLNKIRYFPFMASVHVMNKFACGGSIIKSDLVITAASCLQLAYNNKYFREKPDFISVRVGSTFYAMGGEKIEVMEIFFHPNYVPKLLLHNLAIMRLKRHITFWKHRSVKKIKFDTEPHDLPADISNIIIIGWGATSPTDIVKSPWVNRLSSVSLEYYPFADCQAHYGKDFVTRTNFCLGYFSKGEGACNKDAGGPAIYNGVLIGVISFGASKCGTPDSPTVITKLGYYRKWIMKIMYKTNIPQTMSRTTLVPRRETHYYAPTGYKKDTTPHFKLPVPIQGKLPILPSRDIPEQPVEAFHDLVDKMFPKQEIEKAVLRTNELAAALQPLKPRLNSQFNTRIPPYTHLYSTPRITYLNHPLDVIDDKTDIETERASETTTKKYVEIVSDVELKEIYDEENNNNPALPQSQIHYKAATEVTQKPTFRELLIQDETPNVPREVQILNAKIINDNNGVPKEFAPKEVSVSAPKPSRPHLIVDETPYSTPSFVKMLQTTHLHTIDFDGDRTGLQSHLYDRNKFYNNRDEIKSNFQEVVITDRPSTTDANTEFNYQKDILGLLAASKIAVYDRNPGKPKLAIDGLSEVAMFSDAVPYHRDFAGENPNLQSDDAILKQLYDAPDPMKELQKALLMDTIRTQSPTSSTTKKLDLSVFMLPEKRRRNVAKAKVHSGRRVKH